MIISHRFLSYIGFSVFFFTLFSASGDPETYGFLVFIKLDLNPMSPCQWLKR
jgi:hypothetical protein